MKILLRTTKVKSASEENGVGEVVLAGFKGNCHNCGEPGHHKFDFPNKRLENNSRRSVNGNRNVNGGGKRYRFNGNRNNCGKQGYKSADF